eukprot:5560409-Amphidinium_carterae.1
MRVNGRNTRGERQTPWVGWGRILNSAVSCGARVRKRDADWRTRVTVAGIDAGLGMSRCDAPTKVD